MCFNSGCEVVAPCWQMKMTVLIAKY
ncbi:hypothetical protein BM590_A1240 [Brucella melitensis M5-90]|nr:hypothetical protein BM590_A1240 [Brucella melitensis M5-90]